MAIKRVWHGWTTLENADKYQSILQNVVIPGIEAKNIAGLIKFEVLRFAHEDEVEFVTMMTFEALDNVIALQGEDYKKAYIPAAVQAVLKRWDIESPHYDLVETREYWTSIKSSVLRG